MSRDETIGLLETLRDSQTSALVRHAFNMAIAAVRDAMEQKPEQIGSLSCMNSEKMHDRTTDGQIVRCQDCTWQRPNTGPGYCTVWHRDVDPDGYCHKGAGRDGTWKRENRQENSSNV